MTPGGRSWPWWRWGLAGLSLLALVVSACLAWHSLAGGAVPGCTAGHPCEKVLTSRWSKVGGVLPVSGLAAGAYLAMLVASLSIGPATPGPVRRLAWDAMLILAGAAAGSAVWFTVVQKWLIGAFCPYCMAMHLTGLLLAALIIWQAPRRTAVDSTDSPPLPRASVPGAGAAGTAAAGQQGSPAARRLSVSRLPAIGLLLAGVLAACQIVFKPPPAVLSGTSQDKLPAIDPHAVPLVGSPDALYLVTLLFDYKCPHCQQLHFMLEEAVRRCHGKLAFALSPAPLNTQCNPYVPRDVEEFKDSCELAKVGLAVWLASRETFPAFELWMFSLESGDRWQPRSLDAAKAKAIELVGQAKFDAAWTDPWVDRYLKTSIRLYGDTLQSGNGAIPKLVFGTRWVIPEPSDAEDLLAILQDRLAVPVP